MGLTMNLLFDEHGGSKDRGHDVWLCAFQAKLAPDLVSLLGHHQQQVDPNLLILSNAYQTAENVLTGNADQEDDEDELSEENSLPGGNESGS